MNLNNVIINLNHDELPNFISTLKKLEVDSKVVEDVEAYLYLNLATIAINLPLDVVSKVKAYEDFLKIRNKKLTVTEFINYFGGGNIVIIEEQEDLDTVYFKGTVYSWLSTDTSDLNELEVQTASITENSLVLRVFKRQ